MKYGLRNKKTGELVRYESSSNKGNDDCGSETITLSNYNYEDNQQWMVDSPATAEYVRLHSTEWYNVRHECPKHPFNWNPNDWEVVAIKIETTVKPVDVKIPTMKEYLEKKYKKSNPEHYEHCIKMLEEQPDMIYSIYDLFHL